MIKDILLKKAALKVRKEFESNKINKDMLKKLYQRYNPLKDVDLFIHKACASFPKLNCGLTALYLRQTLGNGRVINGKYGCHNHTYLLMENKVVVDITADQYGGPRVYVGRLKHPWQVKR